MLKLVIRRPPRHQLALFNAL